MVDIHTEGGKGIVITQNLGGTQGMDTLESAASTADVTTTPRILVIARKRKHIDYGLRDIDHWLRNIEHGLGEKM